MRLRQGLRVVGVGEEAASNSRAHSVLLPMAVACGVSMTVSSTSCQRREADVCLELGNGGPSCGREEFFAAYEVVGRLGKGGTATVILAKHRSTGEFVAVKQIDHSLAPKEDIEREIFIMEQLAEDNHEAERDDNFIVKLKDVFRTNSETYVVMDLVPGCELFDVLTTSGVRSNVRLDKRETVLKYARQLVSAVGFVHAKGLLHLDLKPDNVLLRKYTDPEGPGNIRLSDFGAAAFAENYTKSVSKRPNSRAQGTINLHSCSSGTISYWPPEAIMFKDYSVATDMWALGCIFFILVTGKHPFDRDGCGDLEIVEANILGEDPVFLDSEWEGMEDLKEIVRALLEKDKSKRMTEEALCEHELFR